MRTSVQSWAWLMLGGLGRCSLKAGMEGMKEGREPCALPPAEETLLQRGDLASSLRLLRAERLSTGLELLRRIQERLLAILQHSTQVCHSHRAPCSA